MPHGPFYQAGKYHVQVLDVALGESKVREDGSGGNPQVVLRVKVIAGLQMDSSGDEVSVDVLDQYDRTIYLTVTEKSQEMVLKKLRWAGWEGDRFETLTHDLLGRGVRATCRIEQSQSEKYRGQDSEKWDLERPPIESTPLQNNPSVAKKLNALFGKSLKEKTVNNPGKDERTDGSGVTPILANSGQSRSMPHDEIPF